MPRALITGVTGQDGAYLSALLLAKGYEVVGAARGDGEGGFARTGWPRSASPTGWSCGPPTLRTPPACAG